MKPIDCWRTKWWKLWSIRLAAVSAAISAYIWTSPDAVVSILVQIPPWLRLIAIAGFLGLKILVRLTHQPKVTGNAKP